MKASKLNDEESAEKLMEEFGEEVEEKLRLGLSKEDLFFIHKMSILRSTLYSSTTKRYFVVLMLPKAGIYL